MEEVEKVFKMLNDKELKNSELASQMHEINDQIKQNKDNIVKLALMINTKNSEVFN